MHLLKRGAFALGLFVCVTVPVHAETLTPEAAYRQTLIALIERLQEQLIALQAELATQTYARPASEVSGSLTTESRFSDSVTVVARYSIDADVTERIPYLNQRRYLERVFALFPEEYEERLGEFIVFVDEDGYFDAFVETIPPRHEQWAYAVNRDVLGEVDSAYGTELIVHELAHLVGYDEMPGTTRPRNAHCDDYFKQNGGCPLGNSYVAAFADRFWSDADLARAAELRGVEDVIEAAEDYFDENDDEYVTAYAASSPEEDFAESFMYFMLEERPAGQVARAKVDFFGDFAELRSMRTDIRRAR